MVDMPKNQTKPNQTKPKSFWFIDGNLTGTTTPGQSVPYSNANEGVLHTSMISRTGASQSDVIWYTQNTLFWGGGRWSYHSAGDSK